MQFEEFDKRLKALGMDGEAVMASVIENGLEKGLIGSWDEGHAQVLEEIENMSGVIFMMMFELPVRVGNYIEAEREYSRSPL